MWSILRMVTSLVGVVAPHKGKIIKNGRLSVFVRALNLLQNGTPHFVYSI